MPIEFLQGLAQAAKSPYAFVAYLAVVAAWVAVTFNQRQLNHDLDLVSRLPEADRIRYVKERYRIQPRRSLTPEQYLKSRSQRFLFFVYIFSVSVFIIIVTLALTLYHPGRRNSTYRADSPTLEHFQPLDQPRVATPASAAASDGLYVRAVAKSNIAPNRKLFDIILGNSSADQVLLVNLHAKWTYHPGRLDSIILGTAIMPTEKYSTNLAINPLVPRETREKEIALSPAIIIPPRNESGPSVYSFRLEVIYSFDQASVQYHPRADWDISYEIFVGDEKGTSIKLIDETWQKK